LHDVIVPQQRDSLSVERTRSGDIVWEFKVYGVDWDHVMSKARRAMADIELLVKVQQSP
jgi:hypothetical protein